MRRARREQGYIVLECVVALAVLSVGVFAVQAGIRNTLAVRAQARDYTEARFLLQQAISSVLVQPEVVEKGWTRAPLVDSPSRFSCRYKIEKVNVPAPPRPPSPPKDVADDFELPTDYMGKVTAEIRWTRSNSVYTETLETLISPDQLYEPPEPPK